MRIDIVGGRALIATGSRAADTSWSDAPVTIEGEIGGVAGTSSATPPSDASAPIRVLDATGLLVLPGMIDIHGDTLERIVEPRPGVQFPLDLAVREADRQLVTGGITTAYHAVTWSWEPGLRGRETALALLDAIERHAPRLTVDTRIHLRHETYNLDAEAEIAARLAAGRIGCLAFNDHMSGTIKDRQRPAKLARMVERSGLAVDGFDDLIARTYARRAEVPASITRLAAAARTAGVPALSHDDLSPAQRAWFAARDVAIAEFPTTVAAAEAAAAGGAPTVFGAPNVVRGGSHTGCPSAAEMAARGLCTILASDYYYPALLAAPFRLAADGVLPLDRAWALVSAGPADALGLADRGRLAPGRRADVVLVDAREPAAPRVVATVVAGRLCHLAEADRLAA
jgi:alpha-D-ribose 1-methylphosphonate 5-triphosphate diphosphatase